MVDPLGHKPVKGVKLPEGDVADPLEVSKRGDEPPEGGVVPAIQSPVVKQPSTDQIDGNESKDGVASAVGTAHGRVLPGDGRPRPGATTHYHRLQKVAQSQPPSLLMGVGTRDTEWARLQVAAREVTECVRGGLRTVTVHDVEDRIVRALKARGLQAHAIPELLQGLVKGGTLVAAGGGQAFALALPIEQVACKAHDVDYFKGELVTALGAVGRREPFAEERLRAFLVRSARATESWPAYPVESRWPFLKAVSLLSASQQTLLVETLAHDHSLRHFPLIDSALLMIEGKAPEDWVREFAPNLAGSCVYTVAAEGWFAAGGLGRVQQYHAAAMKRLTGDHARVATIEPYYAERPTGEQIDYESLPTPVKGLDKVPSFEFPVTVAGREVTAQIFKGTNEYGVEVYLIRDAEGSHTRRCYAYGRDGTASWEDFSEFFSRASLELVRRLEETEQGLKGAAYKPPAIIANDGQVAPMVPFFRALQAREATLADAKIWMVTHTYKNRGVFPGESGDRLMARWGVPADMRADFWRVAEADVSSAGLRGADGASAVAGIHRDEVQHIDPAVDLKAITNSDNRLLSAKHFRALLKRTDKTADPERPTPATLRQAKRLAKMRIGLDPARPVISYSGRLVVEKAGRQRAFTDENIRALVASGAQVVIYGNVQPFQESEVMHQQLLALRDALDLEGHPGRLVVASGFGIEEQTALLAATDVQVQDSDRGTEAAGYTEADAAANGALQLAPPWLEGILQQQGILVDRERVGSGNTLIPSAETPAAYLDALQWVVRTFADDPDALATYQAEAVRMSRVLDNLLGGAEYLRQLDALLARDGR
ncbi:MAG: glycogen/starch synthase [Deltaproteobacteria bacterium]|nr:glycogen/starch synthase [Deltaproteobacteria bacterium]